MLWLIRMSRWARHPPSWQRVQVVLAVLAICLVIFGIEKVFGWPDWLTLNGGGRLPRFMR